MQTLETERLILRKFAMDDFDAVHSYASCLENIVYMPWGPNSEEQTRAFIDMAISKAEENPIVNFQYAIILKAENRLIGGCGITILRSGEAEVGWTLHRGFWKQGYGPELGKALLDFGFGELGLHRIIAVCDAENYGSYRVMEKIGMRKEGFFLDSRPANKLSNANR